MDSLNKKIMRVLNLIILIIFHFSAIASNFNDQQFYKIAEFNFNNGSLADTSPGSSINNKFMPRKDLFFIDTNGSENADTNWINSLNQLASQELGLEAGTYADNYFTLCRKLPSNYNHVQIHNDLLNQSSLIKSSDWEDSSILTDTLTNNNYNYVEGVWGLSGLYGFRNPVLDGYYSTFNEGYGITDGRIKISYKIKNWNFTNGLNGQFERSINSDSQVSFSVHVLSDTNQWVGGLIVLATDVSTIMLGHGYDPNKWGYGINTPGGTTANKRIGGLYGEFEEPLAVELTIDLDSSTYTFSCGDYSYTEAALYPLTGLTVESVRVNVQHFDFFNFISLDNITISATNPKDSDSDGIFDMYEEHNSYKSGTKTDRFNADTDSDGLTDGEEINLYNTNPTANDTDSDGLIDGAEVLDLNTNPNNGDTDDDGVGDNSDVFPSDPTETTDTDDDGVGDNSDVFPSDPTETTDTDGDGLGNNSDGFPLMATPDVINEIIRNPSVYNLHTVNEIQAFRPGSTMIEVSGNQATVQLQMEESSDLQTWQDTGTPATMTLPADTDTKFFRFKMAE